MKYQRTSIAVLLVIFFTTGLLATGSNRIAKRPIKELNETMQSKLSLSPTQMQSILQLNREYWFSRKDILNNPVKIGKNTAVLACWDRWMQQLSQRLTKGQMEAFIQWQTQVDLLSEHPYSENRNTLPKPIFK